MTDPEAPKFIDLLVRHQNDLLRIITPLVGNATDAQDVLQETAKALWQKFDQFDPDQPFIPWARQFAQNEVLMFHRRKRRLTFLSEELIDQLAEEQKPLDEVSAARRMALNACLEKLSPDDRRLLERRYGEREETVQDLAKELDQTANALYKSLGRIRTALMQCIERAVAADRI